MPRSRGGTGRGGASVGKSPARAARPRRVPVGVGLADAEAVKQCVDEALQVHEDDPAARDIVAAAFTGELLPRGRTEDDAAAACEALAAAVQSCIDNAGDVEQRGRVATIASAVATALFDEAAFRRADGAPFGSPGNWTEADPFPKTPMRRVVFSPGTRTTKRQADIDEEIGDFADAVGLSVEDLYELSWDDVKTECEGLTLGARVALSKRMGPVTDPKPRPSSAKAATAGRQEEQATPDLKALTEKIKELEGRVKEGKVTVTDETKEVQRTRKRLEFLGQRTSDLFDLCMSEFRGDDESWPWAGTTRSARVSYDKLAQLFRGGTKAEERVSQWVDRHGLRKTSEGDQMIMIAVVLDHMLLHDRISMLNSAAVEILCRRLLGLEKSLETVWRAEDVAKQRQDRLRWYDLVYYEHGYGGVEKEVREEMKVESEQIKWALKASANRA